MILLGLARRTASKSRKYHYFTDAVDRAGVGVVLGQPLEEQLRFFKLRVYRATNHQALRLADILGGDAHAPFHRLQVNNVCIWIL